MPFRSKRQQRLFFAKMPELAKEWAEETDFSKLPEKVRKKKKRHSECDDKGKPKNERVLQMAAQFERHVKLSLGASEGEYGGEGPLEFSKDHKPLEDVPKGGSCCANCRFGNAETRTCSEPNYITWNGSPNLPDKPLDEICSDWYQK